QQEHDPLPVPLEEPRGALDVLEVQCDPPAVPLDERLEPAVAPFVADPVPGIVAQRGAGRADRDQRPELHRAARDEHATDAHDHFRRDRREHVLERHQHEDAEVSAPGDGVDDEFVHGAGNGSAPYRVHVRPSAPSRPSIASQMRPPVSVPSNLSIATIPVGEVTLISVSHWPPITSMPTKISPSRLSSGPRAAQISSSRGVSRVGSAEPPWTRFERNSPSPGLRLIAPATSPSTSTMRLSPSATSGRNGCTMCGSGQVWLNTSISAERLSPVSGTRKIALPPLPWIGLTTTAPWRRMNARTSSTLRVTSVGGMKCRKSSTNTFSGALRTLTGLLTTSVSRSIRSSRCVAVM